MLLHPLENLLRLHNVGIRFDVVVGSVYSFITLDEVIAFDFYNL